MGVGLHGEPTRSCSRHHPKSVLAHPDLEHQYIMVFGTMGHRSMEGMYSFETEWGRDIGLVVLGWLLVSVVAIILLLTVVQEIFL